MLSDIEIAQRASLRPIAVLAEEYGILEEEIEPRGWTLHVRDLRLSAGVGFLYALCGNIMTMPGLPARPAGENIDIESDGTVRGFF